MSIGEQIENFLNSPQIREVISYISSSELQGELLILKVVFIFFSVVFFAGVMYFLIKSSFIKAHFWYDVIEFFAWQPYGFLKIIKRWKKIKQRIEKKAENEYKLAIIEADDFLNEVLEKKGYKGESFEERIEKVEEIELPNKNEIIKAHQVRDSVVYDPDFKLELEQARDVIDNYEKAIRNLGML